MVAAGVFLALIAGLWLLVALLLPSNEDLAGRASKELQTRLGVPVKVGAVNWRLFPTPAVVLQDAATEQPKPISVKKLTIYPSVAALMDGRLQVDSAELDGAVLPQLSLRGLNKNPETAASLDGVAIPLARLVFRDVTWVSRYGRELVFEGEADFDPNWRPRLAQVRRSGAASPADLTLTRQGQEDRWTTLINIGGGTANGEVQLQTRDNGRLRLEGKLQPRGVEVADALASFNRRSIIEGRASGETALSANGDTLGEIAQSLQTKTSFAMGSDAFLRVDIDKAVRSFGKERQGKTQLESLTGQLVTQNTPAGMVVTFTSVKATSGAFTATGQAKIANRQVDATFDVDLVSGLVGVPIEIRGPLEKVDVSVPRSAIAGAVVGTAVLPGVGTAIGAKVGAAIGKLFSSEPAPKGKASDKPSR